RNGEHVREARSHMCRRVALIRLDLADGRGGNTDAAAKVSLSHVERATTTPQPGAERELVHVVLNVSRCCRAYCNAERDHMRGGSWFKDRSYAVEGLGEASLPNIFFISR